MRKLNRIISCFVIIMCVVSLLPTSTALAARKRVALGESRSTTSDTYEIRVGESIDLNFYGAKGYVYKTDAGSVFWKSSDSQIAEVEPKTGVIKGIKPGTVTISMTVTVSSARTSYDGSVTVNVKAKSSSNNNDTSNKNDGKTNYTSDGDIQIALVAYDRVIIKYPTEEAAMEAYKKGIKAKRVKKYANGYTYSNTVVPQVSIDNENKNILNIDSYYNNNTIYIFYAEGLDKDGFEIELSWGTEASYGELTYEDAFLSEDSSKDITGKKSLSICEAKPVFKLYDSNNVIIGRSDDTGKFRGALGISGTLKYFMSSYEGSPKPTLKSSLTGFVKLTKFTQTAIMYATWTSSDKKITITTPETFLAAKEYEVPDLGGFSEGIVLTNETGDDVRWSGSEFCQGDLPATKSAYILFYFRGSDGKKYSPMNNAYAATDIEPLDKSKFSFFFTLDEGSSEIASINKTSGRLLAYDEGEVTVYIWQNEPGAAKIIEKSTLVGVLTVTVTEEPELGSVDIDENHQTISIQRDNKIVEFEFTVTDQYGEPYIPDSRTKGYFKVKADSSSYSGTIPGSPISWNGSTGKVRLDFTGKTRGDYYYTFTDNSVFEENITVTIE